MMRLLPLQTMQSHSYDDTYPQYDDGGEYFYYDESEIFGDGVNFNITRSNDTDFVDIYISGNVTLEKIFEGAAKMTKAALDISPDGKIDLFRGQKRVDIPSKVKEVGEENLKVIYKFLLDVNYTETADQIDLGEPHLRSIFRPIYPLAITLTLYLLLVACGLIGNILIIAVIRGKNLLNDNTQMCMLNMATAFLGQLIFVIPFSLFVLVVHNWLLGYVMCYALPMAQVRNYRI